jgi:copper resistance protein C
MKRHIVGFSPSLRVRAIAPIVLAAAVVVLLSAAPASAHDELVGTVPAPGATVSAPGRVRLTFGEDVADVGSRVVVAGPKGPVAGRLGATGPNLVESFPTPLGPGRYTVTWRAVSADGHPVSGRFQFSVRPGRPGPSRRGRRFPAHRGNRRLPNRAPAMAPAR